MDISLEVTVGGYCDSVDPNLRTFPLTVFAHPYCARNSCRNVTPRHTSSARAGKTFQTNIGLVAVALTSLVVYSLKWSLTPIFFFDRQLCFAIQKVNVGSLQISYFSAHAASNLVIFFESFNFQASANVITLRLDILKEHHQLNQFA